MAGIDRTEGNLFVMPRGSYLRNKSYVYINTSNKYVSPSEKREKGGRGYTGHDSVCIGVIQNPDRPDVKKFYDSTNGNSQADGVFIVQKGYAREDPSLCQVNTDYVVRQADGLPLTYLHSPGSVTDIAQAQEMISFMDHLKKSAGIEEMGLCLICDRGYISGKNLRHMDHAGIGYILMLRTTFGLYNQLASSVIDEIKNYKHDLATQNGDERYGQTKECILYEGGPVCYAQIMWSNERYLSKQSEVQRTVKAEREKLEKFITASAGKSFLPRELEWVPSYFKLHTTPGVPVTEERKKRGRGEGTKTVELDTLIVTGYDRGTGSDQG